MKRNGSVVVTLMLAAMLSTGCGSSGSEVFRAVSQADVQGCLLNSVMQLLILGQQAQQIINTIEGGGSTDVVNTGGNNWSFSIELSLAGPGDPDTRITGTVVAPTLPADPFQFNNVLITALGAGTLSGSADLDVFILDENTARVWGTLNVNDSAADCDIALTIAEQQALTLIDALFDIEAQPDPELMANVFGFNLFGTIQFLLDFGAIDVGGSAVLVNGSQDVAVSTDSEFGAFTFKLLPEPEALEELVGCVQRFQNTGGDLIDAIDEILEEATGGDDSPNVTINLISGSFTYEDDGLEIEGSINLLALSVTFAFTDSFAGTAGSTTVPLTVGIGAGSATLNGTVGLTTLGDPCSGSIRFVNARFDTDAEDIEFDDGLTIIQVQTSTDSMEVQIDWGAQDGPLEVGLDLSGISMLINGTPMPPLVVTAVFLFFFGDIGAN